MNFDKGDTFQKFGAEVTELVVNYGQQVSSALVTELTPVVSLGVVLYFTLSGWMSLSGRSQNTIGDSVISAFKISLIAYFGLNAGNYISYGIESIQGLESLLVKAISGQDANGVWDLIDTLLARVSQASSNVFETMGQKYDGAWEKASNFDVILSMFLIIVLFWGAGISLVVVMTIILVITTVGFAIVVGFGPLFICCLMFPYTRSWFDGWLRTAISLVVLNVIVGSIAMMTDSILTKYIDEILKYSNSSDGSLGNLFQEMILVLCLMVTFVYLLKNVTNLTNSLVGGLNINLPNARELSNDIKQVGKTMSAATGMATGVMKGAASAPKKAAAGALQAAAMMTTAHSAVSNPVNAAKAGINKMANKMADTGKALKNFHKENYTDKVKDFSSPSGQSSGAQSNNVSPNLGGMSQAANNSAQKAAPSNVIDINARRAYGMNDKKTG